MSEILTGRYIFGDSILHRMNGSVKLLSFFVLLAAVVMTDSVLGYLIIAVFTAALVWVSRIGLKLAISSISRLWLFFVIIFLMNTVFFETEQVLWSWWIFNVSMGGMVQGANIVLRVILLMILCNVLTTTTTPVEITSAIEKIIMPLKLIGVPTGDVAMILGVALQFIPTFMEESDTIKKAQTARGARFESTRLRDRAASMIPLVVPIFLSAFRRADELSIAMEARGYRRASGRTKRRNAAIHLADMAALLVSCILCVAQILL